MLKLFLIAASLCVGMIDIGRAETPSLCKTIDTIEMEVKIAHDNRDDTTWTRMTVGELSAFKAHAFQNGADDATSMWIGRVTDVPMAYVFGFAKNGCLDGSAILTEEKLTEILAGEAM